MLQSCVSCLGSIVNTVSHNYKLVKDCFRKFFGKFSSRNSHIAQKTYSGGVQVFDRLMRTLSRPMNVFVICRRLSNERGVNICPRRPLAGILTRLVAEHEKDSSSPTLMQCKPTLLRSLFTIGLLCCHFDFDSREMQEQNAPQVSRLLKHFAIKNKFFPHDKFFQC